MTTSVFFSSFSAHSASVFDVRICVMMSCMKVGETDQGDVLHMLGRTLIYSKLNAVLMPLLHRLLLHIKQ